jgi:hypothetical protein
MHFRPHYLVAPLIAFALLTTERGAQAEPNAELGLRLGYAVPMGKTDDDSDMTDGVSGQIPIWLDLGLRITPNVMLGLYGQYGIGMTGGNFGDTCDQQEAAASAAGVDFGCSVTDVRFGAQAHYHFTPKGDTDPWLGVGFGYEWLTFGVSAEGNGASASLSSTGSGFEFVNFQLGLDVLAAPSFGIGPFLAFTLGQYDSYSNECTGLANCAAINADNGDIDNTALHQWLFFGVRGVVLP